MKVLKLAFATALALAYGDAYAFHSGGVAECEGCHSMHNSFENKANVTGMSQFSSGPYLLKANDQSGTCLNCHNSADTGPTGYHISTDASKLGPGLPPVEMTPGGDFAWLKKTYNFFVRGSPSKDDGDRRSGRRRVPRELAELHLLSRSARPLPPRRGRQRRHAGRAGLGRRQPELG